MNPVEMCHEIEHAMESLLLERGIKVFLRQTADRQRTKLTKEKLCALGKKHNFQVAAAGCGGAEDGEWLYDMVWMRLSKDKSLLLRQAMVMECEWRMGVPVGQSACVDLDFQKLAQARADVRVWICTVPNVSAVRPHIDNCKRQIEQFSATMENDQYLFVILIWDGDSRKIESYTALPRPRQAGPELVA